MKIRMEEKHFQWGLTAFLVICCSVLLFFGIYKFDVVTNGASKFVDILAPFIYGLVMAYLLCPIYNITVRHSYFLLSGGKHPLKKALTYSKAIGSIVSVVVLLVVIGGIIWMIIPGLISSVVKVAELLPSSLDDLVAWVNVKFMKYPLVKETIDSYMNNAADYASNTLLPKTGEMAAQFSTKIIFAVSALMDFIIGIIVCIYFLNIKDTLSAQMKKVIYANFKDSTSNEILALAEYTNKTFGGFITGKILDSFIIGCICFVVMSIFGWEYTLLISCIIAITNIIPFFGPFVGAIPSGLLLFIVNPMHALYFLIMILLLQQFDGNILGPKILGDSTGLASFWVLFAIIVGGGLFGFIGMIVGVPVFAVIYAYGARALNRKLHKKGYSIVVDDYKVDKYTIRPEKKEKRKDKDEEGVSASGESKELDVDAFLAAHEHHAPVEHLIVDKEKHDAADKEES